MFRTLAIGLFGLLVSAGGAAAQWTGCGVGVGGAVFSGMVESGSPIGIGTQGEKLSTQLNCDYRMQAFVLGGGVNYDFFVGNPKDLGINNDLYLYGRLGVLVNPVDLLYVHGGWTQLDTSTPIGEVNGWKMGLGNEFRIPNSPIYFDMRYSYAMYGVKDILGPSVDANSHEFRLGLNLKFGPGMFGGKGDLIALDPEPTPYHDPKIAPPAKKQ